MSGGVDAVLAILLGQAGHLEKDAGRRDECHDGLLFPPEQVGESQVFFGAQLKFSSFFSVAVARVIFLRGAGAERRVEAARREPARFHALNDPCNVATH